MYVICLVLPMTVHHFVVIYNAMHFITFNYANSRVPFIDFVVTINSVSEKLKLNEGCQFFASSLIFHIIHNPPTVVLQGSGRKHTVLEGTQFRNGTLKFLKRNIYVLWVWVCELLWNLDFWLLLFITFTSNCCQQNKKGWV